MTQAANDNRPLQSRRLAVCFDCFFWLAEAQVPDFDRDLPGRVAKTWPGWRLTPVWDRDPVPASRAPCDACGSPLGGIRHAVQAWRRQPLA